MARMVEAYQNGNSLAKPDARSWNLLIQAYAKSTISDKATRTRTILEQVCHSYNQGDLEMKPEAALFLGVLNACAYTKTQSKDIKREVVRMALATLKEMDEYVGGPDRFAYRQIFHVVGRHVDDSKERIQMTRIMFERCCQDGFVDGNVLRLLGRYAPSLFKKLPVKSEAELPRSWTRKVNYQKSTAAKS